MFFPYHIPHNFEPDPNQDETYRAWMEIMRQHAEQAKNANLPALRLWLVLRIKKEDFSEKIEMHETIPMMVPKNGCGELCGLALTKQELDALVTPDSEFDSDEKRQHVFLTYRIKIQGQEAWRSLLSFLGENNMLEPE
jgi:hypothetical protein